MTASNDRISVSHRPVLGLLFCCYVVAFVDRGLVSVAAAPIKQDLGLSDAQFGLLNGTAFVALFCLCGIPLGWLADRWDRRALIATALLVWSAMTAACAMATSFGGFCLARVGVGVGESCLVPAGLSLLGSVVPRHLMARAVAIFLMGATVGNAVALLAGGDLLLRIGSSMPVLPSVGPIAAWRLLFLLAAAPGMILALLVMRIHEPERLADSIQPLIALRQAWTLLRADSRAYGSSVAATACVVMLSQTTAAWMPLLYVRTFGLAPGEGALILGVLFVISAPTGQWLGGVLMDELLARRVAAAPNLVQAAGSILCIPAAVVFCMSKRLVCCEAAYAVFNVVVFAATPGGLTAWQSLAPERSRGLIVALLVAAVTLIGVGVGPVAVGLLTDQLFHDERSLGESLLTVVAGAGLAGCAAALLGGRALAVSAARVRPASQMI